MTDMATMLTLNKLPQPDCQYPEELQEAWFSQQLIGFDNMMRARITQRFTQYIDANLEEVTKTSNGQTWTTNLADMYLQGYLMAWQARNDEIGRASCRERV